MADLIPTTFSLPPYGEEVDVELNVIPRVGDAVRFAKHGYRAFEVHEVDFFIGEGVERVYIRVGYPK